MDEYIGMIRPHAGSYAPLYWAFCDGSLLPIRQYTALFAILGNSYGGDGKTTFGLPDLRGRVAIGMGTSQRSGYTYDIGETGGEISNTLLAKNMPAHTHPVVSTLALNCNPDGAEGDNPVANQYSISEKNVYASAGTTGAFMAPVISSTDYTVGPAGAGTPYDNRMPTLAMSYIICIEGNYPPRN